MPYFSLLPQEYRDLDAWFLENAPGKANVIRLMSAASALTLMVRKKDATTATMNLPTQMPSGMPVIILDATATTNDYELLLDAPVHEILPGREINLKRYAKTIQVVSGGYSNSSCFDNNDEITDIGKRMILFVQEHIRDRNDYGIVATKMMENYLVEQKLFPKEKI